MRLVREEPDDVLRAEVGQSVVFLGLVAVIGLMMGLAFQARGGWRQRMRTQCPIGWDRCVLLGHPEAVSPCSAWSSRSPCRRSRAR